MFDFNKEDKITQNILIDDDILKYIIKSIYYPDSPYEFSVLDVEILGNIYEQFLGKTIRLTPSRQVKIEYKPDVKKLVAFIILQAILLIISLVIL